MSEQNYKQFLDNLPPDRKTEVEVDWNVIRDNVPDGYTEEIDNKFLSFKIGKDWYVALANQKNYISLHLLPIYIYPELKDKLDKIGKNLKIGKGRANFKRAEDLPLDTIAEIISATSAESYQAKLQNIKSERKK